MMDEYLGSLDSYQKFNESVLYYSSAFINKNKTECINGYCFHNTTGLLGLSFMRNFLFDAKKIILNFQSKNPIRKSYYLVMNTGAHWSPKFIQSARGMKFLDTPQIMDAFQEFFKPSGDLMNQLIDLVNDRDLKALNVELIPIWRDNLPVGSCRKEDKKNWMYHMSLSLMNGIAREAFRRNNFSTGPNIWGAALPRFHNHQKDSLHYCEATGSSVYRMVVVELMRTIGALE